MVMPGRPSGTGGAELKAIVGEHGVDVVKDGCDLWTGRQIGYRSPRLPLRRGFQVISYHLARTVRLP